MPRWTRCTIGALLLLFVIVLTGVSFYKLQHGLYNALDLGIFNQVFWQTTHGNFFGMTIHPHSYLGDHFALIILFLAPIYAVISRPETLLVLQILAVAAIPIPLLLLVKKTLKTSVFGAFLAVLLTLLWVMNPYLHNAILFEFHLYPIAALLLAWTYYFYRKKNTRWFWIFFLLLLSVREDISLTAFMFAVLAIVERRSWTWWLPQALASVAWFFGATTISSLFNNNESYKFFTFYQWMGEGPREIIQFAISRPLEVLKHLFSPEALKTLGLLASSLLFLAVLTPTVLLLIVPTLLVSGLTETGINDSFLLAHYQMVALTILFIAAFQAIPRLVSWTERLTFRRPLQWFTGGILGALILFPFIQMTLHSGLFVKTSHAVNLYRLPQRDPVFLQDTLKKLQGKEHVMAGASYLPFLGDRETLMSFHYTYTGKQQFSPLDFPLPDIEMAVFDSDEIIRMHIVKGIAGDLVEEGVNNGSKRLRNYLSEQHLGIEQNRDDFLVFSPEGSLEPFALEPSSTETIRFGEASMEVCQDTVCLTLKTHHPEDGENVLIRLLLKNDKEEIVWRSFYLPAYGLHMPADFSEATAVTTEWNLALPPLSADTYTLHTILEPIAGAHPITGLRHAGFLPVHEPEIIDEILVGIVTFNDVGVVGEVQTSVE